MIPYGPILFIPCGGQFEGVQEGLWIMFIFHYQTQKQIKLCLVRDNGINC